MCSSHSSHTVSSAIQQFADAMYDAARGNCDVPLPETDNLDLSLLLSAFSALRTGIAENKAKQELKECQRQTAIADIVHDLRLPLTIILGYTEALQKHMDTTPKKRESYLSAIEMQARDLSALIDSLSAVNRDLSPASMSQILYSPYEIIHTWIQVNQYQLQCHQITIQVTIDESLLLPIDHQTLHRILLNLFSNTIKYRTRPSSAVSISFLQKNKEAVFTYHDDGPGVAPASLHNLFSPRFRENHKTDIPGSGLGLHSVAQIAANYHGTAKAQNENGLIIILTFPISGGSSC